LEDVLEEVVGEIDVGYDFEEYLPRRKRIFEMLDEESRWTPCAADAGSARKPKRWQPAGGRST
jgi:hypothetical protein